MDTKDVTSLTDQAVS